MTRPRNLSAQAKPLKRIVLTRAMRGYAAIALFIAGAWELFARRVPLGGSMLLFGLLVVPPRPRINSQRSSGTVGRSIARVGLGALALALLKVDGAIRFDFPSATALTAAGLALFVAGLVTINAANIAKTHPSAAAVLNTVENLTGGFFCLAMALLVAGFWTLEFIDALKDKQCFTSRQIALTVPLLCVPLDMCFIVLVIAEWAHSPVALALAVARRLRRFPILLRPLPATVWLGHFLTGTAIVSKLENSTPGRDQPLHIAWAIAAFLGFSYASNTFLMAAVGAITRRPRVLEATWRMRILIDVAVAVGVPMLPTFNYH